MMHCVVSTSLMVRDWLDSIRSPTIALLYTHSSQYVADQNEMNTPVLPPYSAPTGAIGIDITGFIT
jgi:hypothetical protein